MVAIAVRPNAIRAVMRNGGLTILRSLFKRCVAREQQRPTPYYFRRPAHLLTRWARQMERPTDQRQCIEELSEENELRGQEGKERNDAKGCRSKLIGRVSEPKA
jgi:hypothetical protein